MVPARTMPKPTSDAGAGSGEAFAASRSLTGPTEIADPVVAAARISITGLGVLFLGAPSVTTPVSQRRRIDKGRMPRPADNPAVLPAHVRGPDLRTVG